MSAAEISAIIAIAVAMLSLLGTIVGGLFQIRKYSSESDALQGDTIQSLTESAQTMSDAAKDVVSLQADQLKETRQEVERLKEEVKAIPELKKYIRQLLVISERLSAQVVSLGGEPVVSIEELKTALDSEGFIPAENN